MTPGEEALLPDLAIIDPHHHLWDRGGSRYLAEQFRTDLDCGHRFLATAFVECRSAYLPDGPRWLRPVGETTFVANQLYHPLTTGRGPVRAGAAIVAYADLALGDAVEEVLAAHENQAQGRLRGIRYPVSWHEGNAIRSHYPTAPEMLLDRNVQLGIVALGKHGLVLDIWAYFTQLDDVATVLDDCPYTQFVLDHCGGPIGIGPWRDRRHEVSATWRVAIAELARRDNIRVKLGGLGMPLAGFDLHKRAQLATSKELALLWAPYILHCIECFGPERCMFESNWPVDRPAGEYGTVWNAFKRLAEGFSPAERRQLFSGVARQTYRMVEICAEE